MDIMISLQEVFNNVFEDDNIKLTANTTSEDIEDWDSLTHMQLIAEIEQKFNVKFTTAEISKAEKVGEFIEILQSKL